MQILIEGQSYDVVVGKGFSAQVATPRPANATPYTAGDVTGATAAIIELPNMGPANGHVVLTTAKLRINVSAAISGMGTFRAYLYTASPPSAFADNAAWSLTIADLPYFTGGWIDFETPVDLGDVLVCLAKDLNLQLKMGTGTSLWAYLVTNGSFTPVSAAVTVLEVNALGA